MVHSSVLFLCMTGLFFFLLSDRFRFAVTLSGSAMAALLCCLAAWGISRLGGGQALTAATGAGILFITSLPLYRNNLLQKLFTALLCLGSAIFLELFTPLLFGALPFSFAGAAGAVCGLMIYVLFFLLLGLSLYHPLHHFSDRTASGFLGGICILLLLICAVALGGLDVLFRGNLPALRVLFSLAGFAMVVFSVRSVYHAAKFREQTVTEEMRHRLSALRGEDYADLMTALREVQAVQKSGEYALDTVAVLLADGMNDRIPEYLAAAKENLARSPLMREYHHNPQLNALIATKAAGLKQREQRFDCSVATGALPLPVSEVCLLADELLSRACRDCTEHGRVSFTLSIAQDTLRMEVLYSAQPSKPERVRIFGKRAEELVHALVEDSSAQEQELAGLDTAREICTRYNGTLTVTTVGEEMNISLTLKR